MKCLITGSQGFVGSNLVPRLIADGHELYCQSLKDANPKSPGHEYLLSNICDIPNNYIEQSNVLIHLASAGVDQNQIVDLDEIYRINVNDSYQLILRALRKGVKRIIYISSCFEYGLSGLHNKSSLGVFDALLPQTQYAATKAALSTLLLPLCNHFAASINIIRTYNLYGPNEKADRLYPSIVRAIRLKEPLHITHGSQIKYFCHVSRLVDLIAAKLKEKPETYFLKMESLGGGERKSVYKFAKDLFEEAGLDPLVYIKRSLTSRPNEPQILIPDLESSLEVFGEPL